MRWVSMRVARLLGSSIGIPLIFLAMTPVLALATVTGGCTATATASKSGNVDLTTATVWHLTDSDVVNGNGKSPTNQTFAKIDLVTFGVPLAVVNSTGNSKGGTAGPYKVSDYDRYTRVLAVTGQSDACAGAILIIIDDVGPLSTLIGIAAAIIGAIGLIGLLFSLFVPASCFARAFGIVLGLLFGLGAGALLQQLAVLDPRSVIGLAFPVVGMVVGAVVPGMLRGAKAVPSGG